MERNRNTLLPNLLTIGNGICGFAALIRLCRVEYTAGEGFTSAEDFKVAAYLVLLGMIFDVFDGKIARMYGGDSALGAQLDSLCDLLTFGVVPAVMIVRLNLGEPLIWQKIVWFLSLAYFLGALLRLARFNVENSPDESAHLAFKGLPTPAAAGCVASVVIFLRYIQEFKEHELQFLRSWERIDIDALQAGVQHSLTVSLPFLALVLGFTMVSDRLKYDHMGSKLLLRSQSFDFLVYLIFALVLLAMVPEIVLPLAFLGYFVWTPLSALFSHFTRSEEVPASDGPA